MTGEDYCIRVGLHLLRLTEASNDLTVRLLLAEAQRDNNNPNMDVELTDYGYGPDCEGCEGTGCACPDFIPCRTCNGSGR